jgi:hypothetical protein
MLPVVWRRNIAAQTREFPAHLRDGATMARVSLFPAHRPYFSLPGLQKSRSLIRKSPLAQGEPWL